jgi:hypothetical protein
VQVYRGSGLTLSALLISFGVIFILAALVGGGLKALNVEIPALRTRTQNWLVGGLGITLMIVGFIVYGHQPPGDPAGIIVTADSIDSSSVKCPGTMIITGALEISEGRGDVTYHTVLVPSNGNPIIEGTPLTAHFSNPSIQRISDTGDLPILPSGSVVSGQIFFRTDSPEQHDSNHQTISLECMK